MKISLGLGTLETASVGEGGKKVGHFKQQLTAPVVLSGLTRHDRA